MRLKISATSENSVDIPFNYHYYLHSTIYRLINSQIRHFKNIDKFFGVCNEKNPIKYFSFSYLSMYPNNIDIKFGFRKVKTIEFYFSTFIDQKLKNFLIQVFNEKTLIFNFPYGNTVKFKVNKIKSLADPEFKEDMKFLCLSPIAAIGDLDSYEQIHYLDYQKAEERDLFRSKIHKDLLEKYNYFYGEEFTQDHDFEMEFCENYLASRKTIQKKVDFKYNTKTRKYSVLLGMYAPFKIKTAQPLMEIGYKCGFGDINNCGMGLVRENKKK